MWRGIRCTYMLRLTMRLDSGEGIGVRAGRESSKVERSGSDALEMSLNCGEGIGVRAWEEP